MLELTRPEPAIAVLRLLREAASNAFDAPAMDDLERHLTALRDAAEVRALVITGAGERAFCAGGDRDYFATLDCRDKAVAMSARMQRLLHELWAGERVVLAAINGAAVGGGCELLTACHVRVAAEHASFRFVHAEHGLVPGWGGTARLVRLLGRTRALDLLLSARRFDVVEAQQLGWVDAVAPRGQALAHALERARQIVQRPAVAVTGILGLVAALDDGQMQEAYRRERAVFGDCWVAGELWRKFGGAAAR